MQQVEGGHDGQSWHHPRAAIAGAHGGVEELLEQHRIPQDNMTLQCLMRLMVGPWHGSRGDGLPKKSA